VSESSEPFVLTPLANSDLNEILLYIARRGGVDAAMRVADRLDDAMLALSRKPGLGHRRDDLGSDQLRAFTVYNYLIIYLNGTEPLQVIRILHGMRDIRAIFAPH
jgi:toxin ParE1/3/4